MQFIPKENFDFVTKDETGVERHVASYVAGHNYHCRTPEMEARALAWEEEGKVEVVNIPAKPVMNPQEGR